jgi:hypothetical protein
MADGEDLADVMTSVQEMESSPLSNAEGTESEV